LTVSGEPAAATFTDLGNGTASFGWPTTASDVGSSVDVTFTASDGDLTDSETVTITVLGQPPAGALIIDNGDAGTSSTGNWLVSGGLNPFGTDSLYANTAGDTYSYTFSLQPGEYSVSAWWTEFSNRVANAAIDIAHANGVDTVTVNHQQNGGQWNPLGTFTFGSQAIVTVRAVGGGTTSADAIRLEPAGSGLIASIDNVSPDGGFENGRVTFVGSGSGANIIAYRWRSSIDGELSDQAVFSTTALSAGLHTIFFSVDDDQGQTSSEAQTTLLVRSNIVADFDNGDTSDWTIVDDGSNISDWEVVGGRFQQQNLIFGNRATSFDQTYHRGSYAFYAAGTGFTNYRFSVEATPFSNNGDDIGIMFRYADNDNYYRLHLNSRQGNARLERRLNGIFTTLAKNARGYADSQTLSIAVELDGPAITVYLNDDALFSVIDSSLDSGTVALYTQDTSNFDNARIEATPAGPAIAISMPDAYSLVAGSALSVTAIARNVPVDGTVGFELDALPCGQATAGANGLFTAQCDVFAQGEHSLDAVLRDGAGTEVDRDTNSTIGAQGEYLAAVGDSITRGTADNFRGDGQSQDGRIVSFQGYAPILNDRLTQTRGFPHIVFNEGVGGDSAADGADGRIDSIVERHSDADRFLVMYGTNDANSTLPVPTSMFRDDMQALVDSVPAGTQVMVARVPPIVGSASTGELFADPLNHPSNVAIQAYNNAIESELTGVELGPDFFSFFLTPTLQRISLFADWGHPNALGYSAMAQLWHNSLTSSSVQPFVLDNLTPLGYQQNLLEEGNPYYVDAAFTLLTIPAQLRDGIWIMTADADRDSTDAALISFAVDRTVTVYVGYDSTAAAIPDWLSDDFTPTGLQIQVSDGSVNTLSVYSRQVAAGVVTLGGNLAGGLGPGAANYIAVIVE
ncbi:MAG: GDSL-type esterase/lipase family protein, partial [Gammaproteobacteria bacterium]